MRESEQEPASVAARLEIHEADVWARCTELCGSALGAVVDRRGSTPLAALATVDSDDLNRVVGLGVACPAKPKTVQGLVEFFASAGQSRYRVELAPIAEPGGIARWLLDAGLSLSRDSVTKVWRDLRRLEMPTYEADIRTLTAVDAEQVAELNVRSWGAWQAPLSLKPWFSATVGREGFLHYGSFIDDRLVSAGALVMDGDLAWLGFDATHPRLQDRQLRRAVTARRCSDAVAAGCRIAHAETRLGYGASRASLLDVLYQRQVFTFADQGASEASLSGTGP